MMTVRHIEKLWNAKAYAKLFRTLLVGRVEASLRLEECADSSPLLAAAALGLVRLDEIGQSHHPFAGKLLRTILASQDSDGGWVDPLTTALCIRALVTARGQGTSVDRGLSSLAQLQKTEGSWPREPIRRLEADAFISAMILFELGDDARFRSTVRLNDAVRWFVTHESALDPEARRLWDHARFRCRLSRTHTTEPASLWS